MFVHYTLEVKFRKRCFFPSPSVIFYSTQIFYLYSSGSGCPFPRNENSTIASAIATPAAAPYAAIPASAILWLMQDQQ